MVKSGKFENVAIAVRTITNAEAVFLIVLNGSDGSGFSVQAESGLNELLPVCGGWHRKYPVRIQITDS